MGEGLFKFPVESLTEEDAELLEGEPAPLKILVDVEIEEHMSDTKKIDVGDVVVLKTGIGPRMVVNSFNPFKGIFECLWFEGSVLCREKFGPEALVIVNESKPA